jgi:hypothetical protein
MKASAAGYPVSATDAVGWLPSLCQVQTVPSLCT